MNKYIFTLKNPIIIPTDEKANRGLLYFKAKDFGLTYSVIPNPGESSINVKIHLVDLKDGYQVATLFNVTITKKGFATGVILNKEAIDKYNESYNLVRAEISDLESQKPIELFVNKYETVINYFEKDGSITDEGIVWAKQLPFLGKTIGYYID